MQGRGWREERYAETVDTAGKKVAVVTGLTRDREGRLVAALAIGDGPTAILQMAGDGSFLSELRVNIASSVADLNDADRRAGR